MALLSIDFGTSYCAAAWLSPVSGKPEAIAFGMDEYNNARHYKFPSAIVYAKDKNGNETKIVGEKAYKRIIAGDVKNSCYKIKTDLAPERFREINGKKKPLAEIVGDLFAEVKEKATQTANQQSDYFDEVVITHPAEFEHKALLYDAAHIAGWQKDKVKLLEEPIAAAYGFSINQPIPDNSGLIVFDYGGGTIDVAYLFKQSEGITPGEYREQHAGI
jgi:molecular chaperone DnaK (HSP70)